MTDERKDNDELRQEPLTKALDDAALQSQLDQAARDVDLALDQGDPSVPQVDPSIFRGLDVGAEIPEELGGDGAVNHPFKITYNSTDVETTVSAGTAMWWNKETPGFDRKEYAEATLSGTGYVMIKLTVAYSTNIGTWGATITLESTDLSKTDNEGNIRYVCLGHVDVSGNVEQKQFSDVIVWGLTGDGSLSPKDTLIDTSEDLPATTTEWEHAVDSSTYGGAEFKSITRACWDESGADQKFYVYYRKVEIAADGTIGKVGAEERIELWDFDANQGDIWYRGSSGWVKLPAVANGILIMNGAGTAPTWLAPGTTGDVLVMGSSGPEWETPGAC